MSSRAFQAIDPLVLSNVGVCWSLKAGAAFGGPKYPPLPLAPSFEVSDHCQPLPSQECLLGNIAVHHRPLPPLLRLTRLSAILCRSLLPSVAQTREIKHGQRSAPSSQRHRHKSNRDLRLEFHSQLHNLCKGQSQMREGAW
jgi:hypothetical protein